ncbi:hypothetical protein D9M72_230170 [compost metagenome]
MRRRDEDGVADLGQRLEAQVGPQPFLDAAALRGRHGVALAQRVPQHVARRRHQQARQHAAHAVADERDVARSLGAALRIEVRQGLRDGFADGQVVQRQRRIRGVVHLPDLVAAAQRLVAEHFVRHVDPGLGAAGQAVQHDDGAPLRVVGLHQVDVRPGQALGAAEQAAQRLQREVGAGQPQAVARGEVGGQRNLFAGQPDRAGAVGVEHGDAQRARGQHVLQRGAVELQQRGEGGEGRFAEGRGVFVGLRRGRTVVARGDQFGAEAVTAVDVAQAREGQRGGGNQLFGRGRVGCELQRRQVGVDAPAAHLRNGGHRHVALAVAAEQAGDGALHRVVVVVAHLRLAVFEGAVARLARRVEQVGVGVARGFQPGLDGLGRHGLRGRAAVAARQRELQPHLGQRRHALLVAQAGGGGEVLAAGAAVLAALVGIGADDAQHFLRRAAELAGGEHVAAPLRQVVGRRDGADRDAGAAREQRQGQQQGEEADAPHGATPGRPLRMACEKFTPGCLSVAIARSVMRPPARSASMLSPGVRPPTSCRYSGR